MSPGTLPSFDLYIILVQVGLRAPTEVAFDMQSWPLLAQAALHAPPEVAYAMAIVIVSSFFSRHILLLTHFEETPVCEIIFAPIFWHN